MTTENINIRIVEQENINVTIAEIEEVHVAIASAFPGFMQGGNDGDILQWNAASKSWKAVATPPAVLTAAQVDKINNAIVSDPSSGRHQIKSIVRLADGRWLMIYEGIPEP